jgi:signal transduction histidine kinase
MALPESTLAAVLMTLVDNAVQAGAGYVEFALWKMDDQIIATVTDNGAGIAESDRDRIFESFFTTRREVRGTGLGPAIARSLLSGNGATLELSDCENGTTFRITAPKSKVE